MNPVEYAWLIPVALLVWWLIKGPRGCILPAVLPMITASEVSQRIAEVIRNIVLSVFEILQPVLTVLGVAQILLGLMLAMGLRQEFLGYRLIVSGIITLVFVYIIAPFLLSFI
jgi:hypothetical protein